MDHKTGGAKDIRDYYKEAGIASLLQGDKEKADRYEKELHEANVRIDIKDKARASWDKLKYSAFSLTNIYTYTAHRYEE